MTVARGQFRHALGVARRDRDAVRVISAGKRIAFAYMTRNARQDDDGSRRDLETDPLRRGAFETDCTSLETATASTWDSAKTRLDKEWTDLKTLVDNA